MKHEILKNQLHAELRKFGLNPQDWSLKKISSSTMKSEHSPNYLIQNKLDKNFSLFGKLEFRKETPAWKSLELASL